MKTFLEHINEAITPNMTKEQMIGHFVYSNNPKFKGKSKAERTKMAIGAWYSMQNKKRS
jgi:hypothetical protein